ncbi:hypothetical protein E0Z10_g10317 [Xylaria hypoxylon]|uniref:Uncharacterized protein n=1 Tax=Xylaria hypoxylon TaxID=37992 RepID=A0A4Z0Y3W3_9PEZI|nr:hypothetical protein E0Z10_g10317 [Xylaria hypoxylon]
MAASNPAPPNTMAGNSPQPNPAADNTPEPEPLDSDAIDPIIDENQKREISEWALRLDMTDPEQRANRFVDQIPWTRLPRLTRYLVARRITCNTMSEPVSQAREANQCCRKLWLAQASECADWSVEKPAIMARFAPNQTTRDDPNDRRFPTQFPPTDKYQDKRGTGSYTFAFKLNPLIAYTWHSKPANPTAADGKPFPVGDPHPACPAPLVDVESMTPLEVAQNVVGFLNATGKVVASVKDKMDNDAKRLVEQLVVRGIEQGNSYDDANARVLELADEMWASDDDKPPNPTLKLPPSPTKGPEAFEFSNRETAYGVIKELTNIITSIMTAGRNVETMIGVPKELTERVDLKKPVVLLQKVKAFAPQGLALDQIQKSAQGIPTLLARVNATKYFSPAEVTEIQKRTEFMVRAHVLGAQIDPLAFSSLRLVKPRYLTWSVSEDPFVDLGNVRSSDYVNCPDSNATRPIDMYRWARLEVASPVFRSGTDTEVYNVLESLRVVCYTLKHRLRTHHCALPTMDGTTSIFIGHTEGFTLLELKKLVMLWYFIENRLRGLHRGRRNTFEGQMPCRPLRQVSRLGFLCDKPLNKPLDDPYDVMPHPSPEQREFIRWQMHEHFACKPLFEMLEPKDELYLRAVWLYSNVTDLARALETIGKPHRAALAIRCYGRGQRTSRLRTSQETMFRINNPDAIFPGEIDEHRGVLEFRQMGQNLNPEDIMAWMHICGSVVRAARETNQVTFRELITMLSDPDYYHLSAWEVLEIGDHARMQFPLEDRDNEGNFLPQQNGTVDYTYPFYTTPEEPLLPVFQGQPVLDP